MKKQNIFSLFIIILFLYALMGCYPVVENKIEAPNNDIVKRDSVEALIINSDTIAFTNDSIKK